MPQRYHVLNVLNAVSHLLSSIVMASQGADLTAVRKESIRNESGRQDMTVSARAACLPAINLKLLKHHQSAALLMVCKALQCMPLHTRNTL